jgi:acyl-coenzyme A thioesterase PaaI-like protein
METVDANGYHGLFGAAGTSLTDSEWVAHANRHLTPNLSALNTRFLDGSREDRWLRMSYEPGPAAMNFVGLSGGTIAEMLDQTATYCGSFVTGLPCPTLSMTVFILRPATTKALVATGRVLKLTCATATLGAELEDESGRQVATVTVVSQLIADLSRLR